MNNNTEFNFSLVEVPGPSSGERGFSSGVQEIRRGHFRFPAGLRPVPGDHIVDGGEEFVVQYMRFAPSRQEMYITYHGRP